MIIRSLPFKINTAILITAVTISILFILILYPLEITRGEEQLKRINLLMETVFKQKLNDLANELFARQERALRATLQDIQTVDGIAGVSVYEENGNLFVASNKELNHFFPKKDIEQIQDSAIFKTIEEQGRYLGIYANHIVVIGEKIGHIVFFYDLTKLKQESTRAITIIFILPIATIFLMAVLLNLFLFRSIIKPVSILRSAMRKVETGHLGLTVDLPGQDEIGDMGAAFNDMSIKLSAGHEALIEAEEKYRSIFENAIEGIFQYSVEYERFITVNPSMAIILEYASPQDLIECTKSLQDSFFALESDWLNYDRTLQNVGRIIGFETELLCKDGKTIWASLSVRRVKNKKGWPIYDEGSFIDITEQLQKKAAERQREAAESASKAKSDFLAKMSHEIRTPLNAILGFADILESSLSDEKQRNYIKIIQSSGANLLTLINDILDLSKIEAGRMEINQSAVNIRKLIDELQRLFSINARQKKIELQTNISNDVPNYLYLDGARLRQVLFNLIGNAVKFTEHGSVSVDCSAKKLGETSLWNLKIAVGDTGPGIEASALEEIFDSFHQHNSSGKSLEGTGLGLAITKSLIEMMNGHIEVYSREGQGSTFTVILQEIAFAKNGGKNAKYFDDEYSNNVNMRFVPACLLVVDDLEINRHHIVTSLKDTQLTLIEAEGGEAALSIIKKQKPDLILMDIRMPKMDGYETLSHIRQEHGKNVPVIAITASGMKEDISKIKAVGFDDYLIRPFYKSQLYEKVASFIDYSLSNTTAADMKNELDQSLPDIANIYSQNWHCTREVADILYNKYVPLWEKIRKQQRLPDIQQFSENLNHLGRQHGLDALTEYGHALKRYAEDADIDNLQKCLGKFKKFLKVMFIE